jgi:hypothetical protein
VRRAAAILFLLTALHTWPLVRNPAGQSLNYNADSETFEWTLSWIAHSLPRHPARIFDGNIFAPEPHVLTLADPLLVPGAAGAPIRWLGGSPVLTFNLLLLAGLTLTAWAGWFVVFRWTGSELAALAAGALTAFNTHLLTRLPHAPAWSQWELPLVVFFSIRLIERPRRRDAVVLALLVFAVAVTSLYSLAFTALVLGVAAIVALPRWRAVFAIGAAGACGFAAALPVLWPYIEVARTGAARPLEMVAQFSATPAGYLASLSRVHAGWTARFFTNDVNVLFAGVTALALLPVGIAASWRAGHRRRVAVLLAVAAAAIVLSFGPATPAYRIVYDWLPPLRGLRAAARFGYLFLLVVAIAAGAGVAAGEHPGGRRGRRLVGGAALACVTIEAWSGPLPVVPFTGVPAIYQHVADAPDPVLLVELPYYPPEGIHESGEYVLNATAHWRPVMNGYSGGIPDVYRRRVDQLWPFPEEWTVDALHREGATHVMVHLERFTPPEVAAIDALAVRRRDLQLIAADRRHRLYRLLPR